MGPDVTIDFASDRVRSGPRAEAGSLYWVDEDVVPAHYHSHGDQPGTDRNVAAGVTPDPDATVQIHGISITTSSTRHCLSCSRRLQPSSSVV